MSVEQVGEVDDDKGYVGEQGEDEEESEDLGGGFVDGYAGCHSTHVYNMYIKSE